MLVLLKPSLGGASVRYEEVFRFGACLLAVMCVCHVLFDVIFAVAFFFCIIVVVGLFVVLMKCLLCFISLFYESLVLCLFVFRCVS